MKYRLNDSDGVQDEDNLLEYCGSRLLTERLLRTGRAVDHKAVPSEATSRLSELSYWTGSGLLGRLFLFLGFFLTYDDRLLFPVLVDG